MVFPDIVKGIGGDSADIVSVGFDVINAVSVVRTDCVGLAVTAFYAGASGVRDRRPRRYKRCQVPWRLR